MSTTSLLEKEHKFREEVSLALAHLLRQEDKERLRYTQHETLAKVSVGKSRTIPREVIMDVAHTSENRMEAKGSVLKNPNDEDTRIAASRQYVDMTVAQPGVVDVAQENDEDALERGAL